MFWLHFSARFGRTVAHVVPASALMPRLHGGSAPLVAVVTPLCAAGPYRWSMGDPAHTATYRVNGLFAFWGVGGGVGMGSGPAR